MNRQPSLERALNRRDRLVLAAVLPLGFVAIVGAALLRLALG